jgi:hypothetical protein
MSQQPDVLRSMLLRKLEAVRPAGGGFIARCPVPEHNDGRPSLSLGLGKNGRPLINCLAGCSDDDVIAALGYTWKDLLAPRENTESGEWLPCWLNRGREGHEKVAEYSYTDEHGNFIHGVTRCASKDFAQWRPDVNSPTGRRWSLTAKDPDGTSRRLVALVPYRLPKIIAAIAAGQNVWLAEGEKDCLRLGEIGIAATCNAGGVGMGWKPEHAAWLAGADVIIVADRDEAGWKHAEMVIDSLLPIARSIEVVRAAAGKDATDHLDAGLGIHRFVQLAVPLAAPACCSDCRAETTS